MRIEWAVPCQHVVKNGELATITGAGVDRTTLPSFPANVQVAMAICVMGVPDDYPHSLRLGVLDPNLVPVADPMEVTLVNPPPHATEHFDGWETNLIIAGGFQWTAKVPGLYTLEMAIDGNVQTVPWVVRLAPGSDDPA